MISTQYAYSTPMEPKMSANNNNEQKKMWKNHTGWRAWCVWRECVPENAFEQNYVLVVWHCESARARIFRDLIEISNIKTLKMWTNREKTHNWTSAEQNEPAIGRKYLLFEFLCLSKSNKKKQKHRNADTQIQREREKRAFTIWFHMVMRDGIERVLEM